MKRSRPAWLWNKMRRGKKKAKPRVPEVACQLVGPNTVRVSRGQVRRRPKGTLCDILKTLGVDLTSAAHASVDLHTYERLVRDCKTHDICMASIPSGALKVANPNTLARFAFTPTMDWTRMPVTIRDALFPFQKEGVEKIITQFDGRCLLADDMGLGKSLQAIATMAYYKDQWPLLIICPSYLRHNWKAEFLKWTNEEDIVLVKNSKVVPNGRITIISYDLVPRMKDVLTHYTFRCIVADESHYIKNRNAQRTKACQPLLRRARRVLLLSGTPLSNRPAELYAQVCTLRPCYFGTYYQFVRRYCDAKHNMFGFDVTGSSNMDELTFVLRETLMVRRLKTHVLTQLPQKTRSQIFVDLKAQERKAMIPGMARWKQLNRLIFATKAGTEQSRQLIFERKAIISDLFHKNAAAKSVVAGKVVLNILENVHKVVVFCVHQHMMRHLQDVMTAKHVGFMFIDGSVAGEVRHANVKQFQTLDTCRVALLSIGAASTGITLTAASTMLFAETSWSPSDLTQAEDRIHRIGQTSAVDIRYLIARETIDENMFKKLNAKLDVTTTLLDGPDDGGQTFTGEATTFERDADDDGTEDESDGVDEEPAVATVDFSGGLEDIVAQLTA